MLVLSYKCRIWRLNAGKCWKMLKNAGNAGKFFPDEGYNGAIGLVLRL